MVPKVQEPSCIRRWGDTHHRRRQPHSHDWGSHRSIFRVPGHPRTTKTSNGTPHHLSHQHSQQHHHPQLHPVWKTKSLRRGQQANTKPSSDNITRTVERPVTFRKRQFSGQTASSYACGTNIINQRTYTAVTLGEIITNRTFTATGTVNATVKRDRLDKTLTIDTSNNTLVQQETKDWDPQTSMMIIDALDAIQWAWILVQIGTETEITTYIDRFKTLTRRNAHRLPNIQGTVGHVRLGDCSTYAHINHIRTDHSKPVSRPTPSSSPTSSHNRSQRNTKARRETEKANTRARRATHGRTTTGTIANTTTSGDRARTANKTTCFMAQHHGHRYNNIKRSHLPPHPPPTRLHPTTRTTTRKEKANRKASTTTRTKDTRAKARTNRDSTARRLQRLR